jgi:transcription termination factor Rho
MSARERGADGARPRSKTAAAVAIAPEPEEDELVDAVAPSGAEPPPIDLRSLKALSIADLATLARERNIEAAATLRKQELIFAVLQAQTEQHGQVYGEGVLETHQDGFGFLRAPDYNYLPGPDDIYVSPSQIRRFNLRTGDVVSGQIRAPKEGEHSFQRLRQRIRQSTSAERL